MYAQVGNGKYLKSWIDFLLPYFYKFIQVNENESYQDVIL